MPQITFRFAAFESDMLHLGLSDTPPTTPGSAQVLSFDGTRNSLALHVERTAPVEVALTRPTLRTRMYDSPNDHDAFNSFSTIHDDVKFYDAYADSADGNDVDADDEEARHWYVKPVRFFAHELDDFRGHLYATAPTTILKEVFRRYRVTAQRPGAMFRMRVVDIRTLEGTLQSHLGTQTTGYTFRNVQSDTAISRLVADGQEFGDNSEVQDVKDRAERIGAIRFECQHENNVLRVSIDELGTVKFSNNPGGKSTLDLLHLLENHISAHSQLEPVTVK